MLFFIYVCFFKQKTAYEMRISDWSSDVCSSDLLGVVAVPRGTEDGSADLEGMGLPDPSPVVVGGRPPMGGEVDAEAFSYLFDDRVRLVLEGELGLEGLRDAPGEERLLGLRRERDRKSTRLNSSHYCASRRTSFDGKN